MKIILTILLAFTCSTVHSIGEGVLDVNALLGIFSGMANLFIDVNTTDINIDRLTGKWHQMYKAAINFDVFQTNLYCQVAYFTKNKVMGRDGFSIVEAFHVIAKNGPVEVYKRDVTRTGTGEFWMYTEEYFYPRQFYIVKVGPEDVDGNGTAPYDYLIATDSNRLALMVFARDPLLFHQYYDKELQGFLSKQGFGGYVFWNQPVAIYQGSDCYYPSEQEVFARRAVKGSQQNKISPNSIQQPLGGNVIQQQQQRIDQSSLLSSQQQSALLNARQQAALLSAAQRVRPLQQQNGSPLLNLQQSSLISSQQQQQQQQPLSSLDLISQQQRSNELLSLQQQQQQQQQQSVIPIKSFGSLQQLQSLVPLSLGGNKKQ